MFVQTALRAQATMTNCTNDFCRYSLICVNFHA